MSRVKIISTRPLSAEMLSLADINDIDIIIHSFIDTVPVEDPELSEEIRDLATKDIIAIFTSMNAVDAVVSRLNGLSAHWETGAIGHTTKQLAAEHFGKLIATGNNAAELANNLLHYEGPFVFFCGDQRRDELPSILRDHQKELKEITVYKTIRQTSVIEESYDGIAFYSPSAVDSFLESNILPKEVIVFAIGTTTADTVKKYVNNKVIITNQPGKNNLVQSMIEYYNNQ